MKIKRYFAPDVRQAMRQIREELGSDAVILSNRSTADGVEVVAAMDYDVELLGSQADAAEHRSDRQVEAVAAPRRPSTDSAGASPAARSPVAAVEERPRPQATARTDNFWSQDPLLREMRQDIESVKSMLKQQLSAMVWGETARNHPHRAEIIRHLLQHGFSAAICKQLAEGIDPALEVGHCRHEVLAGLASLLPVVERDWLSDGGIFSLVGPTGVGKTTTTAKIAAQAAMRYGHRQVALITIDNYRVGAYEQLRAYGRILDVPVRRAASPQELGQALDDFSGRRLVLIDTAGMCQHDRALAEQRELLSGLGSGYRSLLLMSATTSLAGLMDIIRSFAIFSPSGCVLTKLDEAPVLGGALSAAILNTLPIVYSCDGQKVPEDMQSANPHRLAERCLAQWSHDGLNPEEKEIVDLGCLGGDIVNAR